MATEMPTTPGVFTRASSGLVRQVGTGDVLYYGVQAVALSYIIFIALAWGAYPGASMPLASFIAMIGGLAMGVCYALFATLYPRSGGEYVFLSRTLNPLIGFVANFSSVFWQMVLFGINAALFCLFALSPFLAVLGVQARSQALLDASVWVSEGWGMFIVGSGMLLLLAYLQYRGAGVYFRWQRWATYVALATLALTIFVLILSAAGILDFNSNFDELAGTGAYDKVVADGIAAGVAPAASFNLGETMKFMIWPAFSIWFAVVSTSFSGEIKNVQRGQLIGISGSIILMGVAFIVLTFLYTQAFGSDFLLSASANGVPLDAPPYVSTFSAIAGGNVLLTILMSLWVLLIAFFVDGAVLIFGTRSILAWAIDGLAPERLGEVNEKYHSPHGAILAYLVVGEIFLALFAFTDLLGPLSGFLGLAIAFVVVSIWSVFFPFVRKEQFENSPIAWRVGGFPLMSLLGIIATIIVLYGFIRLTVDHTFSINLNFTIGGAIVSVVVAVVWFYAWRAYRKRQGVDIDRRYQEIPIE